MSGSPEDGLTVDVDNGPATRTPVPGDGGEGLVGLAERVSLAELEAKLAKPLLQCFGTDLMAVLVDDRPARFGARKTPARAGPGTGSERSKNIVIGHGHGL